MRHLPFRTSRPLRVAVAAVTCAVALTGLAACGNDDGDDEAAAPAGATSGSSAPAFPVSIDHKYGTTKIEKAPERVVTVGLVEQDALLALGITPVGTTEWFGEKPGAVWEWAQDRLGSNPKPTVLTNTDGVQVEKVAALKPDLILAVYSDISKADYDKLSKFAPVVAGPKGVENFGVSWQDLTKTVGTAVGKPTEANQLVSDVEAKLAKVQTDNPSFKGASAMFAAPFEGVWVYGPDDARGRLLTSLGFTLPTDLKQITGNQYGANLSRERMDLLDVKVLIWLVEDYDKDKKTLGDDPLYNKLKVHTEGRDIYLTNEELVGAASSFITVLSLPYLLDKLVPQLVQAIDGNPATAVERAQD